MHLVPPRSQFNAKFRSDHTRAAIRRITGNADFHVLLNSLTLIFPPIFLLRATQFGFYTLPSQRLSSRNRISQMK